MKLVPFFISFSILLTSIFAHAQEVNFYEKFNRKPTNKVGYTFNVGEIIVGEFRVTSELNKKEEIDPTKIALQFDDGRLDSRAADTFHLTVTPAQYATLRNLIGLRLNGKVKILGAPREATSGMVMDNSFNYPAELVANSLVPVVSAFNPTPNEVQALPLGSPVRIEGTVVSASKDLVNVSVGDPSRIIAIHLYELEMPEIADVSKSEYEIFNNQPVTPGQKVRVLATVGKKEKAESNELVTDWCYRFYLIGLEPSLQANLDQINQSVDSSTATIQKYVASQNYASARKVFGDLAHGKLNTSQKTRLNEIRNSMPKKEQPIPTLSGDARFTATDMNNDFKVNVDQMTTAEYVELMTKVASHSVPTPHEADYMFRLAQDINLPKPIVLKMAKLVLDTYLPIFEQVAKSNSNTAKPDWETEYLLSESIMYYADSVSTVADANSLLKDVNHLNALNTKYSSYDNSRGLISSIFGMANFREALSYRTKDLKKEGQTEVADVLTKVKPEWYLY
jgi:hypothetical protein